MRGGSALAASTRFFKNWRATRKQGIRGGFIASQCARQYIKANEGRWLTRFVLPNRVPGVNTFLSATARAAKRRAAMAAVGELTPLFTFGIIADAQYGDLVRSRFSCSFTCSSGRVTPRVITTISTRRSVVLAY